MDSQIQTVFPQLDAAGNVRWLRGGNCIGVVRADSTSEILPALEEVQRAAERGLYAAGFVAYDAASGIEWHLEIRPPKLGSRIPLLWFALFEVLAECDPPRAECGTFRLGHWQPSVTKERYSAAIDRIKDHIAAGDTYQVNYTFRLRAPFRGEPRPLFVKLFEAQQTQYAAYIETEEFAICSASPELFFDLADGVITTRPMKGTAPRGGTSEEDGRLRTELAGSVKNRAENAMIVDMMRNDLGRVAEVGSVKVSDAFAVEEYPTLFQMTSTVSARTGASLVEIFRALFPCASITGAPKVRTMQIIRELEDSPRGVYTGCIGYVAPGGRARFNVAIRTAAIDRVAGLTEYGTGGGVVWDSQAQSEYDEAMTKAAVLRGL